MIFQSKITLENLIILYLSVNPAKTAHEVHQHLAEDKHPYTLHGILG